MFRAHFAVKCESASVLPSAFRQTRVTLCSLSASPALPSRREVTEVWMCSVTEVWTPSAGSVHPAVRCRISLPVSALIYFSAALLLPLDQATTHNKKTCTDFFLLWYLCVYLYHLWKWQCNLIYLTYSVFSFSFFDPLSCLVLSV